MSERRCSPEDDCSSLLSRLGSDSPRPRMKYGGMFCNVEGAFENKTLNFESLGPRPQRCQAARTRSRDGGHAARRGGGEGGGRTVAFPSGHTRENRGKREDTYRSGDRALYKQTRSTRTKAAKKIYSQKLKELLSANDPALVEYILLQV